jgi:hypothetical protein
LHLLLAAPVFSGVRLVQMSGAVQLDLFVPDAVDPTGVVDAKGVRYLGVARRQPDGTWRVLASVGGALCLR